MKNITKKWLEKKLESIKEWNDMMNIAASNNPFGENIDLRQKAEDYLKQAEQRIQVQIYQKFRIDFFSQLIKELE